MATFEEERERLRVELYKAVRDAQGVIDDVMAVKYDRTCRIKQRCLTFVCNCILTLFGTKQRMRIIKQGE